MFQLLLKSCRRHLLAHSLALAAFLKFRDQESSSSLVLLLLLCCCTHNGVRTTMISSPLDLPVCLSPTGSPSVSVAHCNAKQCRQAGRLGAEMNAFSVCVFCVCLLAIPELEEQKNYMWDVHSLFLCNQSMNVTRRESNIGAGLLFFLQGRGAPQGSGVLVTPAGTGVHAGELAPMMLFLWCFSECHTASQRRERKEERRSSKSSVTASQSVPQQVCGWKRGRQLLFCQKERGGESTGVG